MRRNWHIFLIRICKRAESTMLYPTCACSCAVRYSMQMEDSSTRTVMKDLVFELWILLMYLEIMFMNINYLAIELMIDVMHIVVNINYLTIELIDVVNIVFNSSDVVVKWMCSEFENCTCFIANSIFLIYTWLFVSAVLSQLISILIWICI
jgi:hypothetical protein